MSTGQRAVISGVCAALALLLVGSFLPVWVAWHFNAWEGVGYRGTLGQALAQLPSNVRDAGPYPGLWRLHQSNLVFGAILFTAAGMAGLGLSRVLSKRRTSRSGRPGPPSRLY